MNPRVTVLKGLLNIDIDCDAIVVMFDGKVFTWHCLMVNQKQMRYDEIKNGFIEEDLALTILKSFAGLKPERDIQDGLLYERIKNKQILQLCLNVPKCLCEILFENQEGVNLDISSTIEGYIRGTFKRVK